MEIVDTAPEIEDRQDLCINTCVSPEVVNEILEELEKPDRELPRLATLYRTDLDPQTRRTAMEIVDTTTAEPTDAPDQVARVSAAQALMTELAFTWQVIEVLAPWANAGASILQADQNPVVAESALSALQLLDYLGAPTDISFDAAEEVAQ